MKSYSTGQAAVFSGLSIRTIVKLFDSGRLSGFRVPGSRHRKIPHCNLVEFFRVYNFPNKTLEDEGFAKVLIFSIDEVLKESLQEVMTVEELFKLAFASSVFEIGSQLFSFKPDCVLVDFNMSQRKSIEVCRRVRRASPETILVASVLSDSQLDIDVDEVFETPWDPKLLAQTILSEVGETKEVLSDLLIKPV